MIRDYVTGGGNTTFFEVQVKSPRTHVDKAKGKALYTDYEIDVKTNHPYYPLLHSTTRRRYSEFVWLRNRLGLHDMVTVSTPSLPRKQLIGRFKERFLSERQHGLQSFLNKLVEVNVFLQEPALQLFLQTNLQPSEMDHYIKTRTAGAIKSLIIMLHTKNVKKRERKLTISIPCHDFPLTKKTEQTRCGRGWSSQYGSGYFTLPLQSNQDLEDGGVRPRSNTASAAGVLPGGRLTLPTIPGSMEELSFGSDTAEEEPEYHTVQPLSSSWHGTSTDRVDFLLEDYAVIPIDVITKLEEQSRCEASELGYLDLTTTVDSLYVSSGDQLAFDY